ncbi:MAG: response regulator [Patescibacteria group bacterium]
MVDKKRFYKILIAEDEHFILSMYSKKFKKEGFNVEEACDGEEAWRKVESFNPDVLLLDISMPKKSGIEVLKSIRKEEKFDKLIIVMLTNFGEREYMEKTLNEGANDFLVKSSLNPSEIVEEVKKKLLFKNN